MCPGTSGKMDASCATKSDTQPVTPPPSNANRYRTSFEKSTIGNWETGATAGEISILFGRGLLVARSDRLLDDQRGEHSRG